MGNLVVKQMGNKRRGCALRVKLGEKGNGNGELYNGKKGKGRPDVMVDVMLDDRLPFGHESS